MTRFDGMGPQGRGVANGFGLRGYGQMGAGQGQGQGQGRGQGRGLGRGRGGRMCQRQAGNGGGGFRWSGEGIGRGFVGTCIARLEARIQALQSRLAFMKTQDGR
jgi:hypothetical protein